MRYCGSSLSSCRAVELLSGQGHEVYTAKNVQEALSLLQSKRPQWAMVDFQLSDGDGLDFIQSARMEPLHHAMKVIAVTGWSATQGRVGEFIAAADHYLLKPIDWEHLLQLTEPA